MQKHDEIQFKFDNVMRDSIQLERELRREQAEYLRGVIRRVVARAARAAVTRIERLTDREPAHARQA